MKRRDEDRAADRETREEIKDRSRRVRWRWRGVGRGRRRKNWIVRRGTEETGLDGRRSRPSSQVVVARVSERFTGPQAEVGDVRGWMQ